MSLRAIIVFAVGFIVSASPLLVQGQSVYGSPGSAVRDTAPTAPIRKGFQLAVGPDFFRGSVSFSSGDENLRHLKVRISSDRVRAVKSCPGCSDASYLSVSSESMRPISASSRRVKPYWFFGGGVSVDNSSIRRNGFDITRSFGLNGSLGLGSRLGSKLSVELAVQAYKFLDYDVATRIPVGLTVQF